MKHKLFNQMKQKIFNYCHDFVFLKFIKFKKNIQGSSIMNKFYIT